MPRRLPGLLPLHPLALPARGPPALRAGHFSAHRGEVREWAARNEVELAFTHHYASSLNRIEPQFNALRCFCLAGTDHPDHATQGRLIRRYITWRNAHTDDPTLRQVVQRANTVKVA